MTTTDPSDGAVSTSRLLNAGPDQVFAAFEKPEVLAKWWGPDGFTNTFQHFDFTPGGKWEFVMHAPNGANYPNESVFREIVVGSRIEIEHVVTPWFLLTVTLTQESGKTRLEWVQRFESPEFAERMRPLSSTANEQVLNRLEAVLAGEDP